MSNKKPIIASFIIIILFYLIMSFTVWDLNPKNWSEDYRGFTAFLGTIMSILTFFAIREIETKE